MNHEAVYRTAPATPGLLTKLIQLTECELCLSKNVAGKVAHFLLAFHSTHRAEKAVSREQIELHAAWLRKLKEFYMFSILYFGMWSGAKELNKSETKFNHFNKKSKLKNVPRLKIVNKGVKFLFTTA